MFFVSFSSMWSLTFFTFSTYIVFLSCLILYLVPASYDNLKYTNSVSKNYGYILSGNDVYPILINSALLMILTNLMWSSPTFTLWFGHLVVTSFQYKMTYFIAIYFLVVSLVFTSSSYFSSRESFDYASVTILFMFWLVVLFCTNSIFTSIFVIEVISALIFLLLITSTFSTNFFYRNLSMAFGHYFQMSTPHTFLKAIIFFFWVSLITSLNLFVFLLFFYTKIPTFDWFLIENIFTYLVNVSNYYDILGMGIVWFVIMFSVLLKCGIAPVYIWKPTFFKGIPIYTLFFYISYFYFFIFLFFIYFLSSYFEEVFFFYNAVNLVFIVLGLLLLLSIMCESFYLKVFMAISSILNSLFVLLAMASNHSNDFFLWL